MIIKTIVHMPTGDFKNKQGLFECGPFEPQHPVLSVVNGITTYDQDYDVVVVPEGTKPRLHKWSGGARVDKTAAEIAAWDAVQLRPIDNRVFLARFTDPEYEAFSTLALTNIPLRRLLHTLLASANVDLNSSRLIAGLAYLKAQGVPGVWPTTQAADARIAILRN